MEIGPVGMDRPYIILSKVAQFEPSCSDRQVQAHSRRRLTDRRSAASNSADRTRSCRHSMPPGGTQGQLNRAVDGPLQRLVIRRVAGLVRRPAMAACGTHERCAPTPGCDDCELPAVGATKNQKLREHERESPTKGKEVPGFRGQAENQKVPAEEGNSEHQHAPRWGSTRYPAAGFRSMLIR